jgi:hypothetical protein
MITGLRTARRIVRAAALPIADVQEALPGEDAETDEALTACARAVPPR